ncbi:MAG: hypothetical protein MMC23_007973 [Stictis urceolatum]|nr:hypothetical protein [Stictis urceolata]
MTPNIQDAEPAQPAPRSLKKKDKKDGLRLEWEIHVPFTSREKKPKKETVVEPPAVIPQPYHPFFDRATPAPTPYYAPQPLYTPGAGPSNAGPGPSYPLIAPGPGYPLRRVSYHPDDANIIEVEPQRPDCHSRSRSRSRSRDRHHDRTPTPPPAGREHSRRPHRSQSVSVHGGRHARSQCRRPRERQHHDLPPPTPREHRVAREREVEDRLRELEQELRHTQRRAEIEVEIGRRREELSELQARTRAGQVQPEPSRRDRDRSQQPIFPEPGLRRNQTVTIHHPDGRETSRENRPRGGGGRGVSATRGGNNRWDSGVGIDDSRRELDDRGARVLGNAIDEGRARLRGGWEGNDFQRRLVDASSAAASALRRRNTERIVYNDDARRGGRGRHS